MVTNTRNRWMLRAATFLLWAGAAGCAVVWGLRLAAPASGALVAPVDTGGPAAADPVAVARLLGAQTGPLAAVPVAAVASRFTLLGVLAGRDSGGAALIAVDGKPARPVRVGGTLEEGLVLQSLSGHRAVLGADRDGPATLTLDIKK